MSDLGSVVNFGDLSKPVTVFIEKISEAIGGIAKPGQIKRVAKAEAEAAKIRALSNVEVNEIERRAIARILKEETRNQENIEGIIRKSIEYISDDSKPQELDKDWLSYFFSHAKLISDESMQSVWAKILAEEANEPGNFSKRTIDLVSKIEKKEAEKFVNICSYACNFGEPAFPEGEAPILIITDISDDFYQNNGVSFGTLLSMESIGLITFNSSEGYTVKFPKCKLRYFDAEFEVSAKSSKVKSIPVGCAVLTMQGLQLYSICEKLKVNGYLEKLWSFFESKGYEVEKK